MRKAAVLLLCFVIFPAILSAEPTFPSADAPDAEWAEYVEGYLNTLLSAAPNVVTPLGGLEVVISPDERVLGETFLHPVPGGTAKAVLYRIVLSRGALRALDESALRAVLAHELGHAQLMLDNSTVENEIRVDEFAATIVGPCAVAKALRLSLEHAREFGYPAGRGHERRFQAMEEHCPVDE